MRLMRRLADPSRPEGFDTFARGLQSTFPARDDAPLAVALLGLLSAGRAVTAETLTQTANPPPTSPRSTGREGPA